ncbi:MAG: hypothetical protein EOM74_01310 [Methanomicrobia archaeon]|nr:hypothetical protein [Methanomicrobia archaeon]
MPQHNFFTYGGKIIISLLLEILYFPLWWYSVGLVRTVRNICLFWRGQERALGFFIWAKNILVPMYGQSDFAGRMISFIVRLVQIIIRGLALLVLAAIGILLIILWLILPPVIVLALVFQVLK